MTAALLATGCGDEVVVDDLSIGRVAPDDAPGERGPHGADDERVEG